MTGEHPEPGPHLASVIVGKERTALRLFEKFPGGQLDYFEAAQMVGLRYGSTPDAEGEPRTYKQNPHDA